MAVRLHCIVAVACAALIVSGCVAIPGGTGNPTITVTRDEAAKDLARMYSEPRPLGRPIVVLNGYHTAALHSGSLVAALRRATGADSSQFLTLSYPLETSFDAIADSVVRSVDGRWPSSDPEWTTQVDVIGISMGGLVARWAALPPMDRTRGDDEPVAAGVRKRLNIASLFTFSTPHQGAKMADWFHIDSAADDMRAGSDFLARLDSAHPRCGYEIISYAHRRDWIVGASRAAPPGEQPIWTDGTILFSHFSSVQNPIFVADLAHRVRGEAPLALAGPPPASD